MNFFEKLFLRKPPQERKHPSDAIIWPRIEKKTKNNEAQKDKNRAIDQSNRGSKSKTLEEARSRNDDFSDPLNPLSPVGILNTINPLSPISVWHSSAVESPKAEVEHHHTPSCHHDSHSYDNDSHTNSDLGSSSSYDSGGSFDSGGSCGGGGDF